MPSYDFTQLSSHDFEILVRDLLQAEWGTQIQSFAAGRDQGIDLQVGPDACMCSDQRCGVSRRLQRREPEPIRFCST
jgi:hypothetical protein